jgi:hypothetical protein
MATKPSDVRVAESAKRDLEKAAHETRLAKEYPKAIARLRVRVTPRGDIVDGEVFLDQRALQLLKVKPGGPDGLAEFTEALDSEARAIAKRSNLTLMAVSAINYPVVQIPVVSGYYFRWQLPAHDWD